MSSVEVQTQMEFKYLCALKSLSEKVLFRAWETNDFVLTIREKSELLNMQLMRYTCIQIFEVTDMEYPNGKETRRFTGKCLESKFCVLGIGK